MKRCLTWLLGAAVLMASGCRPAGTVSLVNPPAAGAATRPALSAAALRPLADWPAVSRPVNAPKANDLTEPSVGIVAQAEAFMGSRDLSKAITLLERAKGIEPSSPRIQRDLGVAYAQLGDWVKAEPLLRAAESPAGDDLLLHLLLSELELRQGRADTAIAQVRTGLACTAATNENPDTGEAWADLAVLLERQGFYRAALDAYAQLERLVTEQGRTYVQRPALRQLVLQPERLMIAQGSLLLRLEKPREAAELLDSAFRRDKTNPEAARLAVQALLAARDFDRSADLIVEIARESSQEAMAVDLAVEWCHSSRDPRGPARLVDAVAAKRTVDSAFLIAMAESALDLQSPDGAAAMLSKHLQTAPADDAAALKLARLYERTGDLVAAAGQLASILARPGARCATVESGIGALAVASAKTTLIADVSRKAADERASQAAALYTVAGLLAEAEGDSSLALQLLDKALNKDDRFWPAYEALQDVYLDRGTLTAVKALEPRILQTAGDDAIGQYLIGRGRLESGQTGEAIEALEKACAKQKDHVPTLVLLAKAHAQQRELPKALRRLQEALTIAPQNADAAGQLFDLQASQGKLSDAGQTAARLAQVNFRAGQVLLVRYCLLTHQQERARKILDGLRVQDPKDPEVMLLDLRIDLPEFLGPEPIEAELAGPALTKLAEIVRRAPRDTIARTTQAALLNNQGRYAEAAAALMPMLKRRPYDVRLAAATLETLIKAKQEDQAVTLIASLAGDRANLGPAMKVLLADTLDNLKRYETAEQYLSAWSTELAGKPAQSSELTLLRLRRLKILDALKRYDDCQALLDEWLGSAEAELKVSLRREKVRIFALAGQMNEARAYVDDWQKEQPENYEPRNALVSACAAAKQWDAAHAAVDRWLEETTQADLVRQLKMTHLVLWAQEGKFAEMEAFGRRWNRDDPRAEGPMQAMIEIFLEHKKFDRALAVAQDWLSQDPSSQAKAVLVQALLLNERKAEAMEKAREFSQADPQDRLLLRAMILAMHATEADTAAVLAVQEKLFEMDPEDPGVNNDLGYGWADQGINLAQAESMIRKALAARPGEIAVQDSFGWVLYKLGRFAEAKTAFDQALANARPEQIVPLIYDHAGDAAWRLGQKAEALRLWRLAMDLAKKDKRQDRENKNVQTSAAGKIEAVRKGAAPKVAPLGRGVAEPANP